jgi:nitroreductase
MRCAPSTRRFSSRAVPREVLIRVLDNARFAPSGGNRQGWRVIAVEDAETRRALRDLYLPHWRAYVEKMRVDSLQGQSEGPQASRGRTLTLADEYAQQLDEVPLHLVIGVQLSDLAVTDAQLPRQSIVGGASIYPFVQNVLLGLRAEGLGASLTTLLVPAEAQVRELLDIPEGIALAAHIGVGYRADEWPRKLNRRPVSEFAFLERWGQPL